MKFIFLLCFFFLLLTNVGCQNIKKLRSEYENIEKLVYSRTINALVNGEAIDIVDTISIDIKQFHRYNSTTLFVKVDKYFPSCINNDISTDFKCCELSKFVILLIDLKNNKMSKKITDEESCFMEYFNKIVQNKNNVLDSISISGDLTVLNTSSCEEENQIIFRPLVNYNETTIIDKENLPNHNTANEQFPYLISTDKNNMKRFYSENKRGSFLELLIDSNLLIREYVDKPTYGNISEYKYQLLKIIPRSAGK